MISRTYKTIINKREYEVSSRIYICHLTKQIKFLQSNEFYDKFILNHKLSTPLELYEFWIMHIGRKPSANLFNEKGAYNWKDHLCQVCSKCLVFAFWVAEYYKHWYELNTVDELTTSDELVSKILNENINYVEGFSEAYQGIGTLLAFYHNLVYGIEDDLPTIRKVITKEHINICLKDLNEEVTLEDIEEDIIEHSVLVKKGDHFEWISPYVSELLYNLDLTIVHANSLDKLLTRVKYVS